ncbi:MAG: hypothetical protein CMJ48_02975, partial [Planctomycetaceae bacterium]|nr:hypothetical protein [Planctomycetaceae bacterium]
DSSTEVKRIKYIITDHGSGDRIDKVEVAEKDGASWDTYRTIDFTYHEQVTGAVGSADGDLIGIEEERDLSESGKTYKRRWVYKFYSGTYDASTNPGYPYQVEAVLDPGSVHDFEVDNPTLDIYTRTVSQLSSYVDRTYEYEADKRVDEIDFKSGCGCGGAEGVYTYDWDVETYRPGNADSWWHRATITLPSASGASHIIDYNKYGQTLNYIIQEDATDSDSRRWIRTNEYRSYGFLSRSLSAAACDSYNDSTHVVTINYTDGMILTYQEYSSADTFAYVRLKNRDDGNTDIFQARNQWFYRTSGDRQRVLFKRSYSYPDETTDQDDGVYTKVSYTYHSGDALAPDLATTTLPAIPTSQNGSGSSVVLKDWYELDGLHTWTKDGEGYVHYTGYDADRRTPTLQCTDVNTTSLPTGVPSTPDSTFNTTAGLNIVTEWEYDSQGRMVKSEGPAFDAWNGTSVVSTRTTPRTHYDKLSGGELVVLGYPHVDSAYYHAAISISVMDHDGNTVCSALGELNAGKRDTTLSDDLDDTDAAIENAFEGTIVERTDFVYDGSHVTDTEVWNDADDTSTTKQTTTNTYDALGRLETTTNPAGTITRNGYDVLDRQISRKVGTVDGGGSDNMTLVEESFFDDEEDTSSNVGDGNLTRRKVYTSYLAGGERTTDYTYDYRSRQTDIDEPLDVKEERDYDNRNLATEVRRYDDSGGSPVLMAKSKNYFDDLGRTYESRVYGITGGSGTDYAKTETWIDGRGLAVKQLSQGKVFAKTQYDGAGRTTNACVSYDTDETAYADAEDLAGDTVIEETVVEYDDSGADILSGHYQRRHNGTGTGSLTVGTSGNGRAQYSATWYDPLHRECVSIDYGTNGGTDLTTRPSGSPPTSSDSDKLVIQLSHTIKSEVEEFTDPEGLVTQVAYEDWGALSSGVENYDDGTPGPNTDDDRTREDAYKADGHPEKITAKASGNDQVTETTYGVVRGSGATDSRISSNDLVPMVKYPDPTTGAPGGTDDQESVAYNAQGQVIWRKDPLGTEHVLEYDDRGRLIHDRVTTLGTGLDGAVKRISWTYDALDRPEKVTTYDNATVGSGSIVNEIQSEYDKFGVVKTVYQDWTGAVNTSTSPKVTYTYSFPTNGTTGLRRTSCTYPSGTKIDDVYDSGTDDTINRLSSRKKGTLTLFQESYLGLGELVEREYGDTGVDWTLVGTDSANNDDYVGLDRFGRIDDLIVKNSTTNLNRYVYEYNYNSQITKRDDLVGTVSSVYEFDEEYTYDDLQRLTDKLRGADLGGGSPTIRSHECWELDRSGNCTNYYEGATSTCGTGTDLTFNSSNEITDLGGVSYDYDKIGNMTDRGTADDQVFDAWNRLVECKSSSTTVAKYQYNGLGQKVKRTDSATLDDTYYYHSGARIVEERKVSDGSLLRWYSYGPQNLDDVVVRGTATTSSEEYHVQDGGNDVVTFLDDSGAVDCRFAYDAYGNPRQLSADWSTWETLDEDRRLRSGRPFHVDHSQYDLRARFYDPEFGAFIQRDPVGLWGDAANVGNAYVFAAADPTNNSDPLGLFSVRSQCRREHRAVFRRLYGRKYRTQLHDYCRDFSRAVRRAPNGGGAGIEHRDCDLRRSTFVGVEGDDIVCLCQYACDCKWGEIRTHPTQRWQPITIEIAFGALMLENMLDGLSHLGEKQRRLLERRTKNGLCKSACNNSPPPQATCKDIGDYLVSALEKAWRPVLLGLGLREILRRLNPIRPPPPLPQPQPVRGFGPRPVPAPGFGGPGFRGGRRYPAGWPRRAGLGGGFGGPMRRVQ